MKYQTEEPPNKKALWTQQTLDIPNNDSQYPRPAIYQLIVLFVLIFKGHDLFDIEFGYDPSDAIERNVFKGIFRNPIFVGIFVGTFIVPDHNHGVHWQGLPCDRAQLGRMDVDGLPWRFSSLIWGQLVLTYLRIHSLSFVGSVEAVYHWLLLSSPMVAQTVVLGCYGYVVSRDYNIR
ncbi:hypothetical protein QZH41_018028 [Actinostola sp. cb2023]|nr:hypothetical protein QZH41_018028 [Actinostola sp. cb2023]